MKYKYLTLALFGFLGGVAGSIVFSAGSSIAAKEERLYTTNFYNDQGRRIGVIGAHPSGEGTMFLFNGNTGNTTVQMGAYGAASEQGQSLMGLNDRNNQLRMLLRLHGDKDSPVIVMKDNTGTDRIVLGLDSMSQEPYFQYLDSKGQMIDVIKKN